jgi:hypothetical protein
LAKRYIGDFHIPCCSGRLRQFGNELERTFYNNLAAAQHPQGHDWCYYTSLEGRKPYDKGITCCHSSGPRGMALVPQSAYLASHDTLLVSTFETSSGVYRVWLRAPGVAAAGNGSLLPGGTESRSRQGNQHGSINDDNFGSIAVTFDGQRQEEDWFAVTLAAPVSVRRVVFAHGTNFSDGGWFDASAGKPRVQVQRSKGGAWETLGEFNDYPATTATDNKSLRPGQTFTLRLSNPEKVLAVRGIGVPACGKNPKQSFSSCAELQAFGE